MPGPARPYSARFAVEAFSRPLESLVNSLRGTPEADTFANKVQETRTLAQDIGGDIKKVTHELESAAAKPSNALEIGQLEDPVWIPGRPIGDHTLGLAVTNQASPIPLTQFQQSIVQMVRNINLVTAKWAQPVGGESGWNKIIRTGLDIQTYNTLLVKAQAKLTKRGLIVSEKGKVGIARIASRGMEGTEAEVGQLQLGTDGRYRPFIGKQGEVLVRILDQGGREFFTQGTQHPLWKDVIDGMAEHPLNKNAGWTREALEEAMIRTSSGMNKKGNVDGGDGSVALEHSRFIPWIPSVVRYRGMTHNIFVGSPTEYARRMSSSHASHLAYSRVFGQGAIRQKYVDERTGELVEVIGKDDWAPLREEIIRQAPARQMNEGDVRKLIDTDQRVLNGLPLEVPRLPAFTPAWYGWKTYEAFNTVARTLALTLSAASNVSETLFGTTSATFGVRETMRGIGMYMKGDALVNQLDNINALSKFYFDFSFNKSHPVRDSLRIMQQVAGTLTMQRSLNEMQEAVAPIVAMNKIRGWEQGTVMRQDVAALRSMETFTEKEVQALVSGMSSADLQDRFIKTVSQMHTGSPISPALQSRAGLSPSFSTLFPFLSYGRAKMNTVASSVRALDKVLQDAKKSGKTNMESALHAAQSSERVLLGRHIGFTTAQGAGSYLLLALAFGGATGLSIAIHEAKDEPVKFAGESFLFSTITGPFAQLARYAMKPGDPPSAMIVKSTFPGMMLDELHTLITGQGAYKDRTPFERAVEFMRRRTPLTGPMATGLAVMGLSDRDAALEGAIRGYWKWRFDEARPGKTSPGAASEEDIKFRQAMRRAMDKIRKKQDPSKDIADALAVDGKDAKAAKASIRARRLLKPLTPEEQAALKTRIGDKGFAKLVAYDALLDGWAEAVTQEA